MSDAEAISPTCPRCGYDLSGHNASWESSCPVEGQCSECGLEFAWREVLCENERVGRRHIEQCPRRAIPVAAVRTLLWCITPWVFWKRVRMQHEPSVRRMVLWLVTIVLGLHLVASAATTLAMWRMDTRVAQDFNFFRATRLQQVQSWRRATVSATGLDPVARELDLKAMDAQTLLLSKPMPSPPISVDNMIQPLLAPVLFIRNDSTRQAQVRSLNGPYRSRFAGGWRVSIMRFWKQRPLLVGGVASIMYMSLLALLPATRRRLRVRGVHIIRASVFGMAWLVIPIVLRLIDAVGVVINELITAPLYSVKGSPLSMTWHVHWAFWSWVIFTWISTWWLCVLWKGLRFPRPIMHWAILTAAVVLSTLVALIVVAGVANLPELVSPSEWFGHRAGPHIIDRYGERMIDYVR